jgi:hypothetical protein
MADSGSVEGPREGTHECVTFSDSDECCAILSDLVLSSLERGLTVLCIVDDKAPPALQARLEQQGVAADDPRLSIRPAPSGADGALSTEVLLDLINAQLSAATAQGFSGVLLSLDMQWAVRHGSDSARVVAFEKTLTELVSSSATPLTVLCQYDRRECSAELLALASEAHSHVLAAATYHHDAMLQISRPPGSAGLRIAGELDFARLDPLVTALDEALRIDREVHLDLRHLRFVDVPTAYAIIAAAGRMKAEQRMVVSGGQRITDMMERLGLTDIPGVRLRISHGRVSHGRR